MCIIIVKPFDVDLPSQQEITTCFESNKDGFGLAFAEKDSSSVVIRKGALTIEGTYNMLNMVDKPKDKQMLLHFRTATEGAVCEGNCHPFPLTARSDLLHGTYVKASIAVAHNGVLVVDNTEKLELPAGIPEGAKLEWQGRNKGYRTKEGRFVRYEWTPEQWAAFYNIKGGFHSYMYRE
jgi:predicted glutamine amidotransferase